MIWICPKCCKWVSDPPRDVLTKRFECPDCLTELECHESMYDFKEERRLRKVDESG